MSSEIKVRKDESLDSALRRFKRSCQKSGVLAECRKREHYEKPSVKRKKKSEAARKNNRKRSYYLVYATLQIDRMISVDFFVYKQKNHPYYEW